MTIKGKHMANEETPPEVETKPTKAIVAFVGTLATSLIATGGDGWTTLELGLSALGAVVAATAVYGFRNAAK